MEMSPNIEEMNNLPEDMVIAVDREVPQAPINDRVEILATLRRSYLTVSPNAENAPLHQPLEMAAAGVQSNQVPRVLVKWVPIARTYDIYREMHFGGDGSVFAGRRKADGKLIAIKIPDYIKFIRQGITLSPIEYVMQQMAQVDNPGVHTMITWLIGGDSCAFITERMGGIVANLYEVFRMHVVFSEKFVKSIFYYLAMTVKKCHENGVVHGDIKDENVLISLDTGEVKLAEFDNATPVQDVDRTVCGVSEDYSPPEWFREGRYNGIKRDVWSLGILLFQLMEGGLPFKDQNEIMGCQFRFRRFHNGIEDTSIEYKSLLIRMLQRNEKIGLR